jgi:hypothetical protein
MSELSLNLDELKKLAKNREIRKKYPRFYKLVKKQIRAMEEILKLEAIVLKFEAIVNRKRLEYLALKFEIEQFVVEVRNGGSDT